MWHSPLPRAARSAELIGERLPGVPVREAAELIDHVPHVPAEIPPQWAGVFDGYDRDEAALDAPPARWLGLGCGNTALTAIDYDDGAAPAVLLYNDMGHLPADLRWTGFGPAARP